MAINISAYPALLRVYQWSKNLLLFAALVFAAQLQEPGQALRSLLAFGAFCAVSSAAYVFNDITDVQQDLAHPTKRLRPIPSGRVSLGAAWTLLVALLVLGGATSYWLGRAFFAITLGFAVLMALYTLWLKRVMILDVLIIAIGFVVRAIAGAVVLDVRFSNWLVVCTLFLALFLGLGKRRNEITLLDDDAMNHREVLRHYTVEFLDALIVVAATSTLLAYTIYTCSPEVVERLGTDKLYLTVPFVVYGLFRYLHLVHHKYEGGDPSRTLLKDRPILATVVLWGLASGAIIYGGHSL